MHEAARNFFKMISPFYPSLPFNILKKDRGLLQFSADHKQAFHWKIQIMCLLSEPEIYRHALKANDVPDNIQLDFHREAVRPIGLPSMYFCLADQESHVLLPPDPLCLLGPCGLDTPQVNRRVPHVSQAAGVLFGPDSLWDHASSISDRLTSKKASTFLF